MSIASARGYTGRCCHGQRCGYGRSSSCKTSARTLRDRRRSRNGHLSPSHNPRGFYRLRRSGTLNNYLGTMSTC